MITNRKESCCNKLKKSGLVKTDISNKLKGENNNELSI
ncbi:hypothetical protein CHCC15381_4125 [Bacillus paralicheniformis]|uniref:Uncharacterized protein n=1 Tax=Bacillus paralicheniformis TaxID=1648923 RepID=A0ABY3FWP2_9BACI|nr:hypothetical protein CHCC15381_4125 [Bacillus paralicheniformis]